MEKAKGWKTTLNAVLREHNKAASAGGKAVSFATQAARRDILESGFKELRALGFKLPDVRGFKERHIRALGLAWEAKGLSASTLQNRFSVFRLFAEWIGKKGMIRGSECYVKNPNAVLRHLAAERDKTWSGQKQSLDAKLVAIAQKNTHVALQMELQRAFGLRMKEAALLRPHQADRRHYLMVNWGTKGGRDRVIAIQTDYQRDVLNRAKSLVESPRGSMVPAQYSFKAWRNQYYYVCHKTGISRKDGIVSHGLRHERLNEVYEAITGTKSPIQRSRSDPLNKVALALDEVARQEIAEIAGHSRSSIAVAYIGSRFSTKK
jgi:site-specific recombinase XerC